MALSYICLQGHTCIRTSMLLSVNNNYLQLISTFTNLVRSYSRIVEFTHIGSMHLYHC